MEEVSIDQAMQIAVRHQQAGRLPQAEQICRLILAKQPDRADTLNLLGVLAFSAGRHDLALDLIRRAIAVDPSSPEYRTNLGNLLRADGQPAAAMDAYRQAIELKPDLAELHTNLGSALADQGRLDQAIACHRTALQLNPNLLEAHSNLGNALVDQGLLDQAIKAYRSALALKPYHPEVRSNLAMCLLLQGDYPAGWREYEWRWSFGDNPDVSKPLWDGGDLAGRTILLRAEQGLGDTIQFIRYLPLVTSRGGRVIVECQPELIRLLKQLPFASDWIPIGESLPSYDVWRPLLSLPFVFATTTENIPQQIPPLVAPSDRVEDFRKALSSCSPGMKIGLAWAGRSGHKNDRNRSISLSLLADLARIPNAHFVSLQKGPSAAQASGLESAIKLIDLTDQLRDFADTAALIDHLDLVISVDTSVAHLAGAMGKPVWLLLPFAPDWRWMTGRGDSPWYPTMRLFRQLSIGDWAAVIQQMAEQLSRLARSTNEIV